MDTRELKLLESGEAALWKLANEVELIADSLAQMNEREERRNEAREEKQEREKMETDDRVALDKRRGEARELVQKELEQIYENTEADVTSARALHAIALTLYAREFLK